MSKLLYNGVELPPVPAHDADAAVEVISAVLPAALSMYAQSPYILVIGKGTLWQNGKCYVRGVSAVYRLSGDAWIWHYGSGTVSAQDIVAAYYFEAIWTNTDIPTADGAGIYLAASAPVDPNAPDEPEPEEPPVEPNVDVAAIYRRGWMDGFLTGIHIRGILHRRKVEEPQPVTAYLYGTPSPTIVTYNGVELPELPEWDRETYPYAVIISYNSTNYYFFTCTDPMYIVKESSGTYLEAENSQNLPNNANFWLLKDGVWDGRGGYNLRLGVIDASGNPFYTPIWSNTDIPNIDNNTVYLAASEPVRTNSGNVALADGDGYVKYNGAVLPPLPESDLPYALISRYTVGGDTNYTYVRLSFLSAQCYYKNSLSGYRMTGSEKKYMCFVGDTAKWQEVADLSYVPDDVVGDTWLYAEDVEYNDETVFGYTTDFLWGNFDILTADGEVRFQASAAPIPLASNEPVAAVYGGVKLPAIDSVYTDELKETHPYAAIYRAPSSDFAQLYLMSAPCTFGGSLSMYTGSGSMMSYIRGQKSSDTWLEDWTYKETTNEIKITWYLHWSNFDILDKSGAVHLAAAIPLPIYEQKE